MPIRRLPGRCSTENAPDGALDGFGAGCRQAQAVVRLVKDAGAHPGQLRLLDDQAQVSFRRNAQHNQVAWLSGLLEAMTGFQTGVANLDDLVGQRDVCPDENVDVRD